MLDLNFLLHIFENGWYFYGTLQYLENFKTVKLHKSVIDCKIDFKSFAIISQVFDWIFQAIILLYNSKFMGF